MNKFPLWLGATVVTGMLLGLAACEEEGGPSPTATPSPAAGERGGWEGFRAFAAQIEAALANGDVDFFVERAAFREYVCPGPEEFTPCEREGQVLLVIVSSPLFPSEGGLLEVGPLRDAIAGFFQRAEPEVSDEYGDGRLRLHSISSRIIEPTGTEEYRAVVIWIGPLPEGAEAYRHLDLFTFHFQGGRWQYDQIAYSLLIEGFGAEQYLEPQPEDLNWEKR